MHFKEHPSSLLQSQWTKIMRDNAALSEKNRMLSAPIISLIYERDWLKILVPERYGGKQLPLPKVVALEEALAWADGSLSWTVTLCAGAGWFGGFLNKGFAANVFSDPRACIAGSGTVTGTAEQVAGGYRISGKWMHASGAPMATAFTGNCLVTQNGTAVKDADGNERILSFLFLRNEVNIIPEWNKMGMVATASYPYEVKNVVVPEERAFKIDAAAAVVDGTLYHYPFLQLAYVTLAANISGMAMHFMDLGEALFSDKTKRDGTLLIEDATVFATLQRNKIELAEARANMYHALEQSWHVCEKHRVIEDELLHMVNVSSKVLAKKAVQAVNELYPFCGLSAAETDSEINRVWRDIHTAAQHSLLVF